MIVKPDALEEVVEMHVPGGWFGCDAIMQVNCTCHAGNSVIMNVGPKTRATSL